MRKLILVLLGVLVSVSVVNASTFIDFRPTDPFADALHKKFKEFTVENFTFTVVAHDDIAGHAQIWHSDNGTDGFGVNTGDYKVQEVNYPEILEIRFSAPVRFHEVLLTDFAIEGPEDARYSEEGAYKIDGVGWYSFYATQEYDGINKVNPTTIPLFANATGTSIFLSAQGWISATQHHEFSVGGIRVSQVPLPPAVLLLGSGIIGLAAFRRKFRR